MRQEGIRKNDTSIGTRMNKKEDSMKINTEDQIYEYIYVIQQTRYANNKFSMWKYKQTQKINDTTYVRQLKIDIGHVILIIKLMFHEYRQNEHNQRKLKKETDFKTNEQTNLKQITFENKAGDLDQMDLCNTKTITIQDENLKIDHTYFQILKQKLAHKTFRYG